MLQFFPLVLELTLPLLVLFFDSIALGQLSVQLNQLLPENTVLLHLCVELSQVVRLPSMNDPGHLPVSVELCVLELLFLLLEFGDLRIRVVKSLPHVNHVPESAGRIGHHGTAVLKL